MRSKGVLGILVLAILVGISGCYGCTTNNALITFEESVQKEWANVENQYQRRADLVPALMASVGAVADLERDIVADVKHSRNAVLDLAARPPTSETGLENYQAAQRRFANDLSTLTSAVGESSTFRTVDVYRDLQVQLEGTENRIAVARQRYNESVFEYNGAVRRFPRSLFSGILGFTPKPAFTADSTPRGTE